MRFVPVKQIAKEFATNELRNVERFNRFVNDFGIKSGCYSRGAVTESDLFFNRFLSEIKTTAAIRKAEWFNGQCIDNYYLFDHAMTFNTINNAKIVVSFPYSTPEISEKEFLKTLDKHKCIGNVEMFFLDHKYKFRKNGNFGLVFVNWMVHGKYFSDILKKDYVPTCSDPWSENIGRRDRHE